MRMVAMADHLEARVTLPSEPASARAARSFVTDTLREWGLPDGSAAADSIRLIISELATNAVQHTFGRSPTFTVDLRLERDEELWIGVTDSHPGWPQSLAPAVQQDSGRGVEIIRCLTAELAGGMRVVPTPQGGKTVWVSLPWHGHEPLGHGLLNRFVSFPEGCRPAGAAPETQSPGTESPETDVPMGDVPERGFAAGVVADRPEHAWSEHCGPGRPEHSTSRVQPSGGVIRG